MKKTVKIAALILIIMLGSVMFFSCNKNKGFYQKYFVDFDSQAPITKAVSKINLSSGVSVFSYDSVSDVFVTKLLSYNQYATGDDDSTMTLYGFTTLEKELISPIYSSVISIKGDYAIVTKPYFDRETSKLLDIIGVVKFRGENAGDKTDFTNTNCAYNPSFRQFMFVGDYIAVPGIKASPMISVNYTTFYEYKTKDKLLEVFKVACDYSYDMVIYDNILVAIGKGAVYFFSPSNILQNGFLQIHDSDYFKAFPEDVDNKYTDNISIQVSYIGNGWFIRSSRLESEIEFQGYNLTYHAYDAGTGEGKTMYALVRTDLFNFNTKTTRDNDWLLVDSVANKYSTDAYAYSSDALNNLAVVDESRYEYSLPVLNPSKFIKDGYSIVYFYYTPYVEWGDYTYEVSFCIMDSNANVIRVNDALMPLAFIDGIGIQNVDPTYQSLFGPLEFISYTSGKKVELIEVTEGKKTFETYYAHNGIVIGTELSVEDNTAYFGAVDAKTKKGVIPFIYDELTPFYGKYALGLRDFENTKAYFRVDDLGNETLLKDVVNVKHGVYVYSHLSKLGVKNYSGDVLIGANYDHLEVYDVFTGHKFQTTFAIATSGKNTYIFTLE
ncbi:MAG: hypothetical protein GX242_01115 [Clostridiales bacterium]|nr:hypothetical protein [Clostridiales bacterium]